MNGRVLSEDSFRSQLKGIHDLSNDLKDNWELCSVDKSLYLKKKETVLLNLNKSNTLNISETELLEAKDSFKNLCEQDTDSACLVETVGDGKVAYSFEYHVIYSSSYQVPVLYFNACKPDGSLLSLDQLWNSIPEYYTERLKYERWTFITQQEHPLLGRPFFQLHPCHTAELMGQLETSLFPNTTMNMESDLIISAPGKLIIHGEHAVVYGKKALASSLNIRTFLRLSCNKQCDKILLNLPDVDITTHWSIEEIEALRTRLKSVDVLNPSIPTEEHLSILKNFAKIDDQTIETRQLALVSFLHLYTSILSKQINLGGVCIQVGSNLPPGSGLGSSAAYSTCLAAGFLMLSGHINKPNSITNSCEATWTDSGDLELINKWAFQSEKILHGKPSGIDNAVSTYGGTVIFQHGKLTPVEETPPLDILLTNTKVPRSTKVLVAGVADRHKKFPDVINPVMDSIESVTGKCMEIFDSLNKCENNSSKLYLDLGELIEVNHSLLCALGVSHPSLNQISEISRKYGLHSKLTGAGGGGCAFTLIPPGTNMDTISGLEQDLRKAGFQCWKTQIGGKRVTFHCAPNNDIVLPSSFHVS